MGACFRWAAVAVVLALVCAPAGEAEARARLRCKRGVAKVQIDGRIAWCADSRRVSVVTEVTQSDAGNGLGRGMELIVVLLGGVADLYTMTWMLPDPRGSAPEPTVTWLGKERVGFGYSPVRPDVIASWKLRER